MRVIVGTLRTGAEGQGAAVHADYAGTLLDCAGRSDRIGDGEAAHADESGGAACADVHRHPPGRRQAPTISRRRLGHHPLSALADDTATRTRASRPMEQTAWPCWENGRWPASRDPLLAQTFVLTRRAQPYVMLKSAATMAVEDARGAALHEGNANSYEPPARLPGALSKME
jgi:hypothetical protein